MLNATFITRVFERGGAFSINRETRTVAAFDRYVGLKLPKGDAARDMLLTDTKHVVELATLNVDGAPVSVPRLQVTIYKVQWRWWWESSGDSLAQYAQGESTSMVKQEIIASNDGRAQLGLRDQVSRNGAATWCAPAISTAAIARAGCSTSTGRPGPAPRATSPAPRPTSSCSAPTSRSIAVGETAVVQPARGLAGPRAAHAGKWQRHSRAAMDRSQSGREQDFHSDHRGHGAGHLCRGDHGPAARRQEQRPADPALRRDSASRSPIRRRISRRWSRPPLNGRRSPRPASP